MYIKTNWNISNITSKPHVMARRDAVSVVGGSMQAFLSTQDTKAVNAFERQWGECLN
jgi:hypothetical protein